VGIVRKILLVVIILLVVAVGMLISTGNLPYKTDKAELCRINDLVNERSLRPNGGVVLSNTSEWVQQDVKIVYYTDHVMFLVPDSHDNDAQTYTFDYEDITMVCGDK